MTSPDGLKYVGGYKDGKKNGQGTGTWFDGSEYVGEYKNGYEHGQGTLTIHDGGKYEGEWKGGKKNGQGTFTYYDGDKYVVGNSRMMNLERNNIRQKRKHLFKVCEWKIG